MEDHTELWVNILTSAIDREIEAQLGKETSMNNEPKYKVGDRVQTRGGYSKGTVEKVYMYKVRWDDGDTTHEQQDDIEYAKLSEEDAWIEVALMVGHTVREHMHICGGVLYESHAKEIRHKAYQILGGNGVKVTEEVKQRVRSLIERAKRV